MRPERGYVLCDPCLGRLFGSGNILHCEKRGRIIRGKGRDRPSECHICKGLCPSLEESCGPSLWGAAAYEFETFVVGVRLKSSMAERDDEVRSRCRLAGAAALRAYVAAMLSSYLGAMTGASVDHGAPELSITADLRDNTAEFHPRPVVLSGRYTKSVRGLSQKGAPCGGCAGEGCTSCGMLGVDTGGSVEGVISGHACGTYSARRASFTWVGGEDQESLVGGRGRPFVAQLVQPHRRGLVHPATVRLGGVVLHGLREVRSMPQLPVRFRSKVRLAVSAKGEISDDTLGRLADLGGSTLAVYEGRRRVERAIHSASHSRTGPGSFELHMEVDGGVPFKRFVSGETVFPNLSDLLGTVCSCGGFDFEEITVERGGHPGARGGTRRRPRKGPARPAGGRDRPRKT
ncbi:pseudouridylate synthase [Cenarchaeum symbiosum A]|uniref:tRNA pseudouridine synthase Pus10 n=1 Tax=Cenarchaeum symbiosum (strain A) TaxID=414004 RepID=PUS10_CENSY|nr:RecName: Full=tRNA pseudouridine synthase Pus10; AltName: Full=tRNA pseudouridine 54/55 synthase; Short=Psi54/55 synthase [Cenarchaeum symbiosum A]ABK77057.1 pseudouridylate synthase [Cenarchaeum symbiosum A]